MELDYHTKFDRALLILRIGMGLMFFLHGYPKMMGGMEKWHGLGAYGMGSIGIHFLPTFWGFMAAFSECIGGLMIILGFQIRYFSLLLFTFLLLNKSKNDTIPPPLDLSSLYSYLNKNFRFTLLAISNRSASLRAVFLHR